MNEIIVVNIKLGQLNSDGSLSMSILVTQMDENGHEQRLLQNNCSPDSILSVLEANDDFHKSYQDWGTTCRYGDRKVDVSTDQVNNFSQQDEERTRSTCARDLSLVIDRLNQWMDRAIEARFIDSIINHLVRTNISLLPIKLVFETPPKWSDRLHSLPWDACSGSIVGRLNAINRSVDMVIGAGITAGIQEPQKLVKILIIQGDSESIDTEKDINSIKKYLPENFTVTTKTQPTNQELNRLLWNESWDVIFYLGHTNDLEGNGNIHLSSKKTISIEYLSTAFAKSIELGLRLLVFNSCSGTNIVKKLSEILDQERKKMPHVVVMRRPIGDSIAHEFIDRFCEHLFKDKYSVEQAITQTKKYLKTSASEFPGADSLPVLWCNSNAPQLFIAEPDLKDVEEEGGGENATETNGSNGDTGKDSHTPTILTQLVNILWKPRFMKLPPIAYILAAPLILYGIPTLWNIIVPPTPEIEHSIGSKLLFPQKISQAKKDGIDAFGRKEYDRAIDRFKASLESDINDPEATIYLNNSIVLKDEIDPNLPIIPVISSSTTGYSTAIEVLGGAAVAQMDINNNGGIKGKKVLLRIVLDQNDEQIAIKVAKKLVAEQNIVAVVGHVDSNTSVVAAPIYESGGLTMVSPTSSAMDLKGAGEYIFRTTPNSKMMAESLARYTSTINKRRLGFCYDSKLSAGKTFRDAFMAQISRQGAILVPVNCDASDASFSPDTIITKMQQASADGLVLYYHINQPYQIKAAKDLAQAAKNKLPLFGAHALVAKEITDSREFDNMIVVTPRHADLPIARDFTNKFKQTFGVKPSWRHMTTFDALQAVSMGIEKSNGSRSEIKKALHDPSFSAPGSSGKVRFSISGDRLVTPAISRVQCQTGPCEFVLVTEAPKLK